MKKLNKRLAIKVLDRATTRLGYDDWWVDLIDDLGLYDSEDDSWPSFDQVLIALGVTQQEIDNAKEI